MHCSVIHFRPLDVTSRPQHLFDLLKYGPGIAVLHHANKETNMN